MKGKKYEANLNLFYKKKFVFMLQNLKYIKC